MCDEFDGTDMDVSDSDFDDIDDDYSDDFYDSLDDIDDDLSLDSDLEDDNNDYSDDFYGSLDDTDDELPLDSDFENEDNDNSDEFYEVDDDEFELSDDFNIAESESIVEDVAQNVVESETVDNSDLICNEPGEEFCDFESENSNEEFCLENETEEVSDYSETGEIVDESENEDLSGDEILPENEVEELLEHEENLTDIDMSENSDILEDESSLDLYEIEDDSFNIDSLDEFSENVVLSVTESDDVNDDNIEPETTTIQLETSDMSETVSLNESEQVSEFGLETPENIEDVFNEDENMNIEGVDTTDENEVQETYAMPQIDQTQAWISANNALENNLEVLRDDLRDKGMEDGSEMEALINAERVRAQEEIGQTIEGDLVYQVPGSRSNYDNSDIDFCGESVNSTVQDSNEIIDDSEFVESQTTDIDNQNNIMSQIDQTQVWISANNALENNLEALRDDLRDKGMEDGPEMEAFINAERVRAQEEIGRMIEGDFSLSEFGSEESSDANLADAFVDNEVEREFPELTDDDLEAFLTLEDEIYDDTYGNIDSISSNNIWNNEQEDITSQDLLNEVSTDFQFVDNNGYDKGEELIDEETNDQSLSETLTEDEMIAIHEGLESYDFQGIDYLEDSERLDESLVNFTSEKWENMGLNEQKESIDDLARYIIDVTGLENPPSIEYYNNPEEGDYGGYSEKNNTLFINEYMLHQNDEAADTVAHELWHAFQHQRAKNPNTRLDMMYSENFNDYIKPKDDMVGYQSQLIESEARAFAEQIKERLRLL